MKIIVNGTEYEAERSLDGLYYFTSAGTFLSAEVAVVPEPAAAIPDPAIPSPEPKAAKTTKSKK